MKKTLNKGRVIKGSIGIILTVIIVIMLSTAMTNSNIKLEIVKQQKIVESLDTKELNIVVGNESLAVPSSLSAKIEFGKIMNERIKESGIQSDYVNFSSMRINKSWHITSFLRHNPSIKQVKQMQILGIDYARDLLPFKKVTRFFLPESKKDYYEILPEDSEKRLTDSLAKDNTVFILETGANNLMHELNTNPIEISISKEEKRKAREREEAAIEKVVSQVRDTIIEAKGLKGDNQIYLLGLYTPKYIKAFYSIVEDCNKRLSELAQEENIFFIDIERISDYLSIPDFHPSQEGHYVLATKVLEKIVENINNIEYYDKVMPDNLGIEGIIQDQIKRIEITNKDNSLPSDMKIARLDEYPDELELFQKVREMY